MIIANLSCQARGWPPPSPASQPHTRTHPCVWPAASLQGHLAPQQKAPPLPPSHDPPVHPPTPSLLFPWQPPHPASAAPACCSGDATLTDEVRERDRESESECARERERESRHRRHNSWQQAVFLNTCGRKRWETLGHFIHNQVVVGAESRECVCVFCGTSRNEIVTFLRDKTEFHLISVHSKGHIKTGNEQTTFLVFMFMHVTHNMLPPETGT